MSNTLDLFKKYAPEIFGRMPEEDFAKMLKHIQIMQTVNISLIITPVMTVGEFSLTYCAASYSEEHNGSCITVAQLAAMLGISMPAVSRTLRNLQKKGYIDRRSDENDRRNVLITVTENGYEALGKCISQLSKLFSADVLSKFTDKQLREFVKLFCRLIELMECAFEKIVREDDTEGVQDGIQQEA